MKKIVKLPDFIIVGATKCGTSSIYRYLMQHPDIFMPGLKEINYFLNSESKQHNSSSAKNFSEYASFFKSCPAAAVTGEVAPNYLASTIAAENIKRDIPNAKIIIMLRDPVQRSFSAYLMAVREGNATHNIEKEMNKLDAFYNVNSHYYVQIQRFYKVFPHSNIHILFYEDFLADNISFMQKIYKTIGVEEDFIPDISTRYNPRYLPRFSLLHNLISSNFVRTVIIPRLPNGLHQLGVKIKGLNAKKAPSLTVELETKLRQHFAPDIEKTAELIQCDLSHWMPS